MVPHQLQDHIPATYLGKVKDKKILLNPGVYLWGK